MIARPTVEFYDDREVVVINGTKYTYYFFEQLGQVTPNVGQKFEVVEKKDGNVTMKTLEPIESQKKDNSVFAGVPFQTDERLQKNEIGVVDCDQLIVYELDLNDESAYYSRTLPLR